MAQEGYWIIRTYESGPVGEKIKAWIPGARPTKSERRMKQDLKKARSNRQHAERELARLINANFTAGDILIGLDYSDDAWQGKLARRAEKAEREMSHDDAHAGAGESEQERLERAYDEHRAEIRKAAQQELKLWTLRVQRACKKAGAELKYISITSDMDGETHEDVRVHHHIIVNREAAEIACAKWTNGGVDHKKLSAQPDYTPLAAYLIRQVRHEENARAYAASYTLERPQPKDRAAISDAELRVPKDCALLYRSEYVPGQAQYIRYILRRRKRE